MRRSASGGRFGAGAEGTVGTGRSVIGGGVGYEGDDLVGGEPGAASEVGELYEEGNADDGSAGGPHELAHPAGGCARGGRGGRGPRGRRALWGRHRRRRFRRRSPRVRTSRGRCRRWREGRR